MFSRILQAVATVAVVSVVFVFADLLINNVDSLFAKGFLALAMM